MKHIVIVTTGSFPTGDSTSFRLQMVAKAIIDGGNRVTVLCRGALCDSGEWEGVKYFSLKYRNGNKVVKTYERIALAKRVKKYLNENKDNIDTLYLYCGQVSVFKVCKKFCKKYDKGLIRDCPDWFSHEQYKFGKFSIFYQMNNRVNTKITDKSFDIVAISHYLEKHFKSKGNRTLYVPVLCDSAERTKPKEKNSDTLKLFYAGIPGKKDFIVNLLESTLLLTKEEKAKIRISLVGVNRKMLIDGCGISSNVLDSCADILDIHGRVPKTKVLEMMEEADFLALPRDAEARYAKAGFPSKVTESLANATPILCNISSDLGEYLVDGENAIISKDHSPMALVDALRRAIALTPEEKNAMSKNALDTAREKLDYHLYTEKLKKFIEGK